MSRTQSETQSQQASQSAKTNKTYLDFKDSLSENERESFLNFARGEGNKLPSPPTLLDKWVEKNWVELRDKWNHSRRVATSANNKINWESHPKFPEWLAHIKAEGHQIFILFGDSTLPRKDREKLVEWVKVKGLLEVAA